MDLGAAAFLVMVMCSYGSFDSSACNASAGALWQGTTGQQVLDKLNREYLDPVPKEWKAVAGAGYVVYQKRARITLYHGLYLDVGAVTNSLTFRREWQ